MTRQQVEFDPDALVQLAAHLREAARAASAISVAVGRAERRAGELGEPSATPSGSFDALDYLAFGAPTVRGLRTVALDAPVLADEIDRRIAHFVAAENAYRLGHTVDVALWFADARPLRLDVVRTTTGAVEALLSDEELDFDTFDGVRRALGGLSAAECQAVVGGLETTTLDRACDQLRLWFLKITYALPPAPASHRHRLLGMLGTLLAAAPAALAERIVSRVPAAEPSFGDVSTLRVRQFPIDDWAAGMHYREAGGELVRGGVSADDVRQRAIGDCWFVAGLVAVAQAAPQLVADNVRDNGNGTVTVTFYRGGEPVPVTVATGLPYAPAPRQYPFAVDGPGADVTETWGPLYEKAFAQLHGSYGSIEYGQPGQALPQLVGRPADAASPEQVSHSRLSELLDTGHAVTLGTGRRWLGLFGTDPGPLDGRHVYTVIAAHDDGSVQLRDPRYLGPGTEIVLPWSAVQQYADALAWVSTR